MKFLTVRILDSLSEFRCTLLRSELKVLNNVTKKAVKCLYWLSFLTDKFAF